MYDKESLKENGHNNGKSANGAGGKHHSKDKESDASELSQTSDIEPLEDDDDQEM